MIKKILIIPVSLTIFLFSCKFHNSDDEKPKTKKSNETKTELCEHVDNKHHVYVFISECCFQGSVLTVKLNGDLIINDSTRIDDHNSEFFVLPFVEYNTSADSLLFEVSSGKTEMLSGTYYLKTTSKHSNKYGCHYFLVDKPMYNRSISFTPISNPFYKVRSKDN